METTFGPRGGDPSHEMIERSAQSSPGRLWLFHFLMVLWLTIAKALTKYERPKMKMNLVNRKGSHGFLDQYSWMSAIS